MCKEWSPHLCIYHLKTHKMKRGDSMTISHSNKVKPFLNFTKELNKPTSIILILNIYVWIWQHPKNARQPYINKKTVQSDSPKPMQGTVYRTIKHWQYSPTLEFFRCFFRHSALEPSICGGAKSIHILLCFFHAVQKTPRWDQEQRTIR